MCFEVDDYSEIAIINLFYESGKNIQFYLKGLKSMIKIK